MKWDAFLSAVQERGEYPSREEAEQGGLAWCSGSWVRISWALSEPSWPPGFRRPSAGAAQPSPGE